jgi:hypothetical protein
MIAEAVEEAQVAFEEYFRRLRYIQRPTACAGTPMRTQLVTIAGGKQ